MRIALIAALVLTAGCAAEIGDDCETNQECGQGRMCDLTQDGGYCTITPCVKNGCPEEAVCIEFKNKETYCMRMCEDGEDCREGYQCLKKYGDYPFCIEVP